ncbi:uncharacterized protein LOC124493942 [Dermatophagoides farinae]|uniref:uncharacterized protein LOC124493942 n=1 Tax=Dermatophagoides farinae TaxID=6954 RepID=UPI003F5EA17D
MLNMINSDAEMVDGMAVVDNVVSNMSIKNEPEDFNGFNSDSHSHLIEEESLDDGGGSSTNASDASSLTNASSDLDEQSSCSDDTVDDDNDDEKSSNDSDSSEILAAVDQDSSEISSVVFPLETIQIISEQNEIQQELTEDAALLISEDVSYRIRELIHCSSQFMRHSFCTKLSAKNVFQAMQELDCDLIFGHNNTISSNNNNNNDDNETIDHENYFIQVPSAEIFIAKHNIVDLKMETMKILKKINTTTKKEENGGNKLMRAFDIDWFSLTNPICDNIYYLSGKSNLIDNYFQKLTELLLNNSKISSMKEQNRCLKVFLNDLSKNRSVKSLLCPLFYFIRNTIISWEKLSPSNDDDEIDLIRFNQTRLKSISRLLTVLGSMIRNDEFVDLTFDSKIFEDFAETIMMFCFESNSLNVSCTLVSYFQLYPLVLQIRSYSSYLFTQLLYKFSIPFTDIQHRLMKILCSKIRNRAQISIDNNDNLLRLNISSIDFAILNLFHFLGFDMCIRYLLPLLTDEQSFFYCYFHYDEQHDEQCKEILICQHTRNLVLCRILMVVKLILKGLILLMTQKPDDLVIVEQSDSIYKFFAEFFGDSLYGSLVPVIETLKLNGNFEIWLKNWRKLVPNNRKQKHKQKEYHHSITSAIERQNSEKSPNKSHKKKGTGLLESMLSTDTTKMPKNESLSMFTDSLLDSSHKQYEKVFLYQQDFDDSSDVQSEHPSKCLIVFDGHRLPPKNTTDDEDDGAPKKVKIHSTTIPYKNSEWYNQSVNYRFKTRQTYHRFIVSNINQNNTSQKIRFDPNRHSRFHYHRLNHHTRICSSLYTHL